MTTSRPREWRSRPLVDDWNWQALGRCRETVPELFFPEDYGRAGLRAREERAKQICRDCPVVTPCREHALNAPETHGVWGAMSARERARSVTVTDRLSS
jgi:WhiB family redox-sensing transcriptional regulator